MTSGRFMRVPTQTDWPNHGAVSVGRGPCGEWAAAVE